MTNNLSVIVDNYRVKTKNWNAQRYPELKRAKYPMHVSWSVEGYYNYIYI